MNTSYAEHAARLAERRAKQAEKAQQIINQAARRDAREAQKLAPFSADYGGKADPGTGVQRPTETHVTNPEHSQVINPERNQ